MAYAVKRLLVNISMYKLNGIMYFHHLIFRSIPSSLTNNEEAYAECLPGQRTGEGSGSLPLLPPWLRANSGFKVPLNPSLVNEVRSTRSKSHVKGVYTYDMFIHS